ncbi:MAG: hypothetical protein GY710_17260 [Desulfobacteraceae bacterium]|nr:hypothetical protein [Desulfobacteraceae bacterium]
MINLAKKIFEDNKKDYTNVSGHPCVLYAADFLAAFNPGLYSHLPRKTRDFYWGQDGRPSLNQKQKAILRYAKLWGGRSVLQATPGDVVLLGIPVGHVGVFIGQELVAHLHRKTRQLCIDKAADLDIYKFYRM